MTKKDTLKNVDYLMLTKWVDVTKRHFKLV